ncbi:V-type ATP synthase subunit F [Clostridium sp. Marseille-P299]|uniref:V-type ATP synthase subunit F n=1 Tax=Clostridium sp. Marseille-P299 TaxID=1805477 RepID=UPI00083471FA|nr:V-type ATP synthase subunit F [Clostridium sp. Marseille-P299]
MYKIAVLGDRDSIYGFAALGLDTFPVSDRESAVKKLREIVGQSYAVIYVTEKLQEELSEEIDVYRNEPLPAIIPIPGVSGNTGKGMLNVKKSVERAVGSDIIFNMEEK